MMRPEGELISGKIVEKGTCEGFQFFTKRNDGRLEQRLILYPASLKDVIFTVSFIYSNESESEILKIIRTIKCSK